MNAASILRITPVTWEGDVVAIEFPTVLGKRYDLERTTDFSEWEPVAENLDGTDGMIRLTDQTAPASGGYYRIRLIP